MFSQNIRTYNKNSTTLKIEISLYAYYYMVIKCTALYVFIIETVEHARVEFGLTLSNLDHVRAQYFQICISYFR